MTPQVPVLEFNVRFGDPECQPIMQLGTRYSPWLYGAAVGALLGNAHVRSRCLCMLCRTCVCRISVVVNKGCPDTRAPYCLNITVFFAAVGPKTGPCDEWWSRVGSECPCGIDSGGTDNAGGTRRVAI